MKISVMQTPTPLALAADVSRKIRKNTDFSSVLRVIGEDHVEEIQRRIAVGEDAYGDALEPLSQMTLDMRERIGIARDTPLWDTGAMKSSWRYTVKSGKKVVVKPSDGFNRDKVARDMYGGLSTIHKIPVPVRDAFSVNFEQVRKYEKWLRWHSLGGGV